MIYLNNAGTTWPKPDEVNEAMSQFSMLEPDQWSRVFYQGIETATSFFGIGNPDRFLITQSCTLSLAVAFSDFPWNPGDRLIVSSMEHHALSRWYHKLQQERGIEGVMIPRSDDGPFDLSAFEKELKKGARMVAVSMASNVTGEMLPFEEIIRLSKEYGAFCLLDGAQAAGIIAIDLSRLDPDFFVFAGHKGTFGPQGTGGLYISERVSMSCPSATCEIIPGEQKPASFPGYCDAGSAPMIAIAGLTAGLKWIEGKGLDSLVRHRQQLAQKMRDGLHQIEEVRVMGGSQGEYTGAVSITSHLASPEELSKRLWREYGIKGSHGFQCAPLTHEALGTGESGTLRFSVGPMNTEEEIDALLSGLKTICKTL